MRDTPAWRRHGRQACLAADRSDGRKAESLDEFWQGLRPEQQMGIKAVAMDMWEPYIRSTYERLDGAEKRSCSTSSTLPNTCAKQRTRCGGRSIGR